MHNYGLLTLVPAIAIIVMSIKTKRGIESLFLGSIIAYIITDKWKWYSALVKDFFAVLTDYDNVWMLIVCGLFGSLIMLLNETKGTYAIGRLFGKVCKGAKSTLFASWFLGVLIFIDDYLSIMTISACMKKMSDKYKVPREALAYVVDSTSAPVCTLIPFSAWAVFYAGVFYEMDQIKALGYGSALSTYLHVMPFIFYSLFAIIVVPAFAMGIFPALGAMKKAYQRTRETGKVYSKESEELNQEEPESENQGNLIDFLIPMGLLVIVTWIKDDLFLALVISMASCIVLAVPRKLMTFSKAIDLIIKGFADLMPILLLIAAALLLRKSQANLNLPEYVINHVLPYVNASTFPAVVVIVVSGLAFITASNWGIPAVCVPIIVPIASAVGANLLLVMAAIVSGGTFSSHACFYSDATALTSTSCGVNNMDHALTQIPYAMISLAFTVICFLIAGFIF